MKLLKLVFIILLFVSCSVNRNVKPGVYSVQPASIIKNIWIKIYLGSNFNHKDSILFINEDHTFKYFFDNPIQTGNWTSNGKKLFLYTKDAIYTDTSMKMNKIPNSLGPDLDIYSSPTKLKIKKNSLRQIMYFINGKKCTRVVAKFKLNAP